MEQGIVRPLGVIANPNEEPIAREFFELFKVPWEFYQKDRQYEVVLCAGDAKLNDVSAKVLLLYAGDKIAFDVEQKIPIQNRQKGPVFSCGSSPLPIYDYGITFGEAGVAISEESKEFVRFFYKLADRLVVRVGYDLFKEIGILVTTGQPFGNGSIPTLDLHIGLLRDLITGSGFPLVEIPPVPDGYAFIACLTHDVDHASIRRHKFDHTMFGFLYRSTFGSAIDVCRGRMSSKKLFVNCIAAAKLPLMYFGLAKDIWMEFDRYTEIEDGKPSTFFFVPFEGVPGLAPSGAAPASRATRYDISHVAQKIPKLIAAGCEIGLHGLDAWADSLKGRGEAERIASFTGVAPEMGIRMHWLYWNKESPVVLENAGFSYDSTAGFNEVVGYKAGTCQVFRPLGVKRLLELPLHVMDTALFHWERMNLSPREAWSLVNPLVDNAVTRGGVLTVNWHDRSLAPERLWGDFYVRLLDQMESRKAWFSTARQAVSWFQKRRDAAFEGVDWQDGKLHVKVSSSKGGNLPDLRLRVHQPRSFRKAVAAGARIPANYMDTGFQGSIDARFSIC